MKNNMDEPNILIFDIETAPNLGYIWGKYEQDVIEYDREWYMLSFAFKWHGEKKVQALSLPDYSLYEKNKEDDRMLVASLWHLFDKADIIIAHNGDAFDVKKTNARFIYHGSVPPSPYKTIDTKKVARRYFNFNSNKLDDLADILDVGRKVHTGGFKLWKGCMEGDMKSWKKMVQYNKQDVKLLEDVYMKMLPWMTSHPNRGLLDTTTKMCPNCGSTKVQRRGFSVTRVNTFQRWQCTGCGAWCRSRLAEKIDKPELV